MIIRRVYITLLELLLVIAILGLIAGIIGINATKAWQEQRFRTEVSRLVDQIRLAQDLMLIFNASVQVKITKIEGVGIDAQIVSDTPLPKRWSSEINRPRELLTMIKVINFPDLIEEEDNVILSDVPNQVTVKYLSGGSRISRGLMRISTSNTDHPGALTRYISFPGVPGPIETVVTYPGEGGKKLFTPDFGRNLTVGTATELGITQ